MIKKLILLLVCIFACGAGLYAQDDKTRQELDRKLSSARTEKDSVAALYNLFDYVPRTEKLGYARTLYNLTKREGDVSSQLDLLRQISQLAKSDSAFKELTDEVSRIPDSREQRETALFLRLRQVIYDAKYHSEEQRQKKMAELIAAETDGKKPVSEHMRILRLFTIVEYLSNGVNGDLLDEYVKLLGEQVDKADIELYVINNVLLTEAANIYSYSNNHKKAVEADRKLIKVIADLKHKYHSRGRVYRNYGPNYYIVYRRMLSNFEALDEDEIEDAYKKVQELMEEDVDVAKAEKSTRLAELYYSMAKKDYATAIPILQARLAQEKSVVKKRRYLKWLQEAAEASGDQKLLVEVLSQSNDILRESEALKAAEKYKELQVRFDVNELRAENAQLEIENREEEISAYRKMMSVVMIGWVLFAILLAIGIFYWSKYKASTSTIQKLIDNLIREREYMKENIYHDYYKNSAARKAKLPQVIEKKVIEKRPRLSSIPAMLQYLINDMLYIDSIGNSDRRKYVHSVNVQEMLMKEADAARENLPQNVELKVKYPGDELTIVTDGECCAYTLRHIFKAANRVATKGTISVECREDRDNDRLQFVFNNSDVIVPEGSEEVMFDGFIDLRAVNKRADVGLFLGRMSAFLLDCTLRLVSSKEGSTYVLSVPFGGRVSG